MDSYSGKVICQVCKEEIEGTRMDGLPVAKDHSRPNGGHCPGSRIFALPVEKRSEIRSYAASKVAGEIRIPAIETHIHHGSICSKFCSSLAMIFK